MLRHSIMESMLTLSIIDMGQVMPDSLERDAPPRTRHLYDRVARFIPPVEWGAFAADIDAILALKRQRNAVILAHNYQTPEIFHCVSDIVGDSLALAREAMTVDAA